MISVGMRQRLKSIVYLIVTLIYVDFENPEFKSCQLYSGAAR